VLQHAVVDFSKDITIDELASHLVESETGGGI
ncbi:MAG: Rrf2 family transcriptional regulator, partial [Spirochaetia bacterium]|nr:Rrf2 family transcriptional regulator [Spirochaetia bacterium]